MKILREHENLSLPAVINIIFILVSTTELIAKTERVYYLVFAALLFMIITKRRYIKIHYIFALFLYCGLCMLSCFWTPAENMMASCLVKLVVFVYLYFQIQFDYTHNEYEVIKTTFLWQFLILFAFALLFGNYGDGRLWIRVGNERTDPNCLAGWALIPLCFALEILFDSNRKVSQKIIPLVCVACTAFLVTMGGSRAGIVVNALAVVLCTAFAFRTSIFRNPGRAVVVILFTVILGYVIYINIPPIMILRFTQRDTIALGGRSYIWEDLFQAMRDHPEKLLFGFGEGAARYYTRERNVAHNIFLDALFSEGIPGFLLLVYFIIRNFKDSLKKRDGYLVIAYVCIMVLSCTLEAISQRFEVLVFFLAAMSITPSSDNGIHDDECLETQNLSR